MNYSRQPLGPVLDCFTAPYFFFSNQSDSVISYVSSSVTKVLGYEQSDLIGKSYLDFVDTEHHLNSDLDHCSQLRFQQSMDESSTRLRVVFAADATRRILQIQTYGEKDQSGNVIYNHGLAQDVTDSFLLEANLNGRLSSLDLVVAQLTDREKGVLERVMEGRLNKSIARELDVSERTVESARSRLMKKFGANTTAELVRYSTEYYMLTQLIQSVHGTNCLPKKMDFLERIKLNSVRSKAKVGDGSPL